MNILVISKFAGNPAPSTIYVHNQVKAMLEIGHSVFVITPRPFFKHNSTVVENTFVQVFDGVNYIIPSYLSFSNFGEYSLNNFTFSHSVMSAVRKLIRIGFTPNIIHSHTFSAESYVGLNLQQRLGVPCVITTHGSDLRLPLLHGKSQMIIDKCKRASGIIAVSKTLKETLVGLDKSISPTIITNGFSLVESSSYKKSPFLITSCGNLVESKKFDLLIKSFHNILPFYPKARLHIIGSGKLEFTLKSLCKELQIQDRVHFLGSLSNKEVLKEMNRSVIFALPSINEGFGIVYLEALSQKCLVIATKGEGFSSIVEDRVHCLLVEPNSVDSLSDAIIEVFETPSAFREIAKNGYEFSLKYTWKENANKTINFFYNIIK